MTIAPVPKLADRYHELMTFRREALAKYHATELSVLAGPPTALSLPTVSLTGPCKKKLGPLRFRDNAPISYFVNRAIEGIKEPVTVLEIGPGNGDMARSVQERHGSRISEYFGYDRDASLGGQYLSLRSLGDVRNGIDVIVASEVIEHMPADVFYASYLVPLARKMAINGSFIVSTPNPIAPGGISRDVTHVQHYPWYDLYALFRLAFDSVVIRRSFYLYTPSRILALLPRITFCSLLELDWRDGLVCVARGPRCLTVDESDVHESSAR